MKNKNFIIDLNINQREIKKYKGYIYKKNKINLREFLMIFKDIK